MILRTEFRSALAGTDMHRSQADANRRTYVWWWLLVHSLVCNLWGDDVFCKHECVGVR